MSRFVRTALFFLVITVIISFGCSATESADPAEAADMVLLNGKIVTVDDSGTEVQAIAVKGGKIVAWVEVVLYLESPKTG